MIFNSLELQGFKSFPDKTKISFERGVTAIVGPNGSGKSNVSDAIRWVLGEMSLKSLRSGRMEDVIFNGSPGRPAANFAYVTIEFVDDDGAPLTITRKYYRTTKESEYYINKQQVRLKDVYERFYNTGIGREGYSVIGQGKIAEVLSQKGDERRSIFEEAAGISKIRAQKTESERKLAATENNLLRLNDIFGEVASRLAPLEKEAENAKKYLALSTEKKGLEITLWLQKIEKYRSELEVLKEALENDTAELEFEKERCETLDKQLDELITNSFEASRKASEEEQCLAEARELVAKIDNELAVKNNDIAYLSRTVEECTKTDKTVSESTAALKARLEEVTALHGKARTDYSEAQGLYNESILACREAAEKVAVSREKVYECEERRAECSEKLTNLSLTAAKLTAELEGAEKNALSVTEKETASTARIAEIDARIAQIDKQIEEKAKELEKAEALMKEASAASSKKYGELDKAEALQRELTAAAKATADRRETLERMERLFEGYADSVKKVMSAFGSSDKVNVHGIVSSVISVDERYVVAVETALGAASQYIIVGNEGDAKSCIEYLRRTNGGRATFLPLTTVNGTVYDKSNISGMKGFIGMASDICSCDGIYSGIVKNLLGRTAIAEDLDAATEIARKASFKLKIVTLDGQVINAGGSFTGGSGMKKVGLFTRAMDIERLTAQYEKQLADAEKASEDIKRITDECNEADDAYDRAESAYNAVLDEHRSLTAERKYEEVRREEEKRNYEGIATDRDAETSLLGMLKDELEARHAQAAETEAELAKAKAECEAASAELEAALEAEKKATEDSNARYREMIEKSTAFSRLNEQFGNLSEQYEEAERKQSENVTSLERAQKQADAAKADIERLSVQREEAVKRSEEIQKRIAEGSAKRDAEEKRIVELKEVLKSATEQRDELFKRTTSCQSRYDTLVTDYDNVTSQLWDEYELTYSSAEEFRLPDEMMKKAPSRLASLRSQIKALGSVNANAVEEYKETRERYDFLSAQIDDLNKTRRSLDSAISKLEVTMTDTFLQCFEQINITFDEVFTELFGGGSAQVILSDPTQPLTCGIDITIKPPSKSVRSISLLSGGEQSFAAIALYLALQKINPAPFCIFDEIESALDEVNVSRLAEYIKAHSDSTQYIVITHRRGTMERADTIYGIIMQQKGISDYMKLNLAAVKENSKKYGIK